MKWFGNNRQRRCGNATVAPRQQHLEWTASLSFEEGQALLQSITSNTMSARPKKRIQKQNKKSVHSLKKLEMGATIYAVANRARPISLVDGQVDDEREPPLGDRFCSSERDGVPQESSDNSYVLENHRYVGKRRSQKDRSESFLVVDNEFDSAEPCLSTNSASFLDSEDDTSTAFTTSSSVISTTACREMKPSDDGEVEGGNNGTPGCYTVNVFIYEVRKRISTACG